MFIKTIRVHPAIGIARLGRSPEEYFIGPEVPACGTATSSRSVSTQKKMSVSEYRDSAGLLKRQAARFRLFAYDKKDRLIGEVTSKTANITWKVHLKNTKAVGRRFEGLKRNTPYRNQRCKDRTQLELDPGEIKIQGRSAKKDFFCRGKFMGRWFHPPLKLGTVLTDENGRLLVLGGHGRSGTLTGAKLRDVRFYDFANQDGWYDDISDGSVKAKVRLKTGRRVEVIPAWVIVGPPKFAPEVQNVVTLFDTLYQIALENEALKGALKRWKLLPRKKPSFTRDVYPILQRASDVQWLFAQANVGHHQQFQISRARKDALYRQHLFRQFRPPIVGPKQVGAGTGEMPYMWSDFYPKRITATLTPHQYGIMAAWAIGNFDDDWESRRKSTQRITPFGLDRAALEACVGAPFSPGIEVGWKIRDEFKYCEPFRLDARLAPGAITQQMSIPWQSDFVDCRDESPYAWWPAQRPIDVIREVPVGRALPPFLRWARKFGFPGSIDLSVREMIRDADRLGLLKRVGNFIVEYGRQD
jgi:hypothetical protein